MIKIRLITFRAMGGPRAEGFKYLFAKDSFENLKKGDMNDSQRGLGKNLYPWDVRLEDSRASFLSYGFMICVCN